MERGIAACGCSERNELCDDENDVEKELNIR